MAQKKTSSAAKEKLFATIPALYAWLTVGGLSAIVLIVQLVLISKA